MWGRKERQEQGAKSICREGTYGFSQRRKEGEEVGKETSLKGRKRREDMEISGN